MFENIECEWPMFFCYLIIDALFTGDKEAASEYIERLEEVILSYNYSLNINIINIGND